MKRGVLVTSNERTHFGKDCSGKTLMATSLEAKKLVDEKMFGIGQTTLTHLDPSLTRRTIWMRPYDNVALCLARKGRDAIRFLPRCGAILAAL